MINTVRYLIFLLHYFSIFPAHGNKVNTCTHKVFSEVVLVRSFITFLPIRETVDQDKITDVLFFVDVNLLVYCTL